MELRYDDLPIYEIVVDEEDNQGIRMVSLVAEPAIETKGMFFSNDHQVRDYAFKSFGDKQIVAGPAMIPNKKILRKNDDGSLYYVYFTQDTIQQMVNKFLKDNNNKRLNVEHTNERVDGYIQASWIVEDPIYDKSKFYGFDLPKGSWFIEVKIDDKDFWENKVKKDGKFGFSIEGLMGQKLVQMNLESIDDEKVCNCSFNDVIDSLDDAELINLFFGGDPGLVHPNCKCMVKKGKFTTDGDPCEICIEAKRQWEINGAFSNVFGTYYSRDIFGENASIGFFSNVDYTIETFDDYPKQAMENAKIALRWAEENGWGSCGTSVGKARANQLSKGEKISRETIARMAAFERHRQNSQKELGDGCGRLMWLAWGGDAGIEWASRKLKQIDSQKDEFVIEPGEKESKDEFIQRCMSEEVGGGYDTDQAYAICISKWEKK
jgi:hypothetical protein